MQYIGWLVRTLRIVALKRVPAGIRNGNSYLIPWFGLNAGQNPAIRFGMRVVSDAAAPVLMFTKVDVSVAVPLFEWNVRRTNSVSKDVDAMSCVGVVGSVCATVACDVMIVPTVALGLVVLETLDSRSNALGLVRAYISKLRR